MRKFFRKKSEAKKEPRRWPQTVVAPEGPYYSVRIRDPLDVGFVALLDTKGAAEKVSRGINALINPKRPKSQGRRNRAKGLSFERKVCDLLRPLFPNVKRHLEFQASEANGVDLDHTGEWRIQCKKGKQYVSIKTIYEVKADSFLGERPLLITEAEGREGAEAMAVMRLADYLDLLAQARAGGLQAWAQAPAKPRKPSGPW